MKTLLGIALLGAVVWVLLPLLAAIFKGFLIGTLLVIIVAFAINLIFS